MQDELFQRQWNSQHEAFTKGLNATPRQSDKAARLASCAIGRTYDEPVEAEDPPIRIGTRMVAAGMATALLWITVIGFASTMGVPFVA
jgi:hypothetical protein